MNTTNEAIKGERNNLSVSVSNSCLPCCRFLLSHSRARDANVISHFPPEISRLGCVFLCVLLLDEKRVLDVDDGRAQAFADGRSGGGGGGALGEGQSWGTEHARSQESGCHGGV